MFCLFSQNSNKITKNYLNILLVEDSAVLHKVMSRLLKSCGHTVEIAMNGSIGLESMKQNAYDLVLMDLEMPIMNGYEATRRYRQHESENELNRTPIIAISANDVIAIHQFCIDAGMDDFIAKPFNLKQLYTCLYKLNLISKV